MSIPCDMLVFGGTGDLALHKLLPALYHLHREGRLHADVRILALARSSHTREAYQALAERHCRAQVARADFANETWASFAARLDYFAMDAAQSADFGRLAKRLGRDDERVRVYYLATAPSLFEAIAAHLANAGLAGPAARIVLEKPIGHSLESARAINAAIGAVFDEARVFRIDHYLGKETVQNLLALRFGNILFEPVWNAAHIDHVQITVAETVGLEGRAGFYEGAGALRDMVQNHMLQLLALVAMEPPSNYDPTSIRDEKVKVLRSLRPLGPGDSVTGQYREGAIGSQPVPVYDEEMGRDSDTETFVALKAHIDNWRWNGVPFLLRTGKRLPERKTEIMIQFKAIPHSIFAGQGAKTEPNKLIIGIQPRENVGLSVMAKIPGLDRGGVRLREVPLDISMPDAFAGPQKRIAYERLLLDLIEGNQTLFVRRDEVEAQWEWIDAIRAGWAENAIKPRTYTAGSWGPAAAIALAERDGFSWHE